MNKKGLIPSIALSLMLSLTATASESLTLTSPNFEDGGLFPIGFTCEGDGISPPLNWSGVPAGTQSLVLIMDHMPNPGPRPEPKINQADNDIPPTREKPKKPDDQVRLPEGLRWYWTMYNIPTMVSGVAAGGNVGTLGTNVVNNQNEYAPPCSKGPGPKSYAIHLYALSDSLAIADSEKVSESTLRKAMEGLVIESTSINASFERGCPAKPNDIEPRTTSEEGKPTPKALCEPAPSKPSQSAIEQ